MKKMVVGLGLLALCFSAPVFAATLKVGVVDVQQVLKSSPRVSADKTKLQAQFKPQYEKIQAAQKSLEAMVDNLHKNGSTMQAKDRTALQASIQKSQESLMKQQQGFQSTFMAARSKDMQDLLGELQNVMKTIAQKNQINVILPKSGVVYSDSNLDMTSQVEKAFDAASK